MDSNLCNITNIRTFQPWKWTVTYVTLQHLYISTLEMDSNLCNITTSVHFNLGNRQ